jgi:hypothetical protein
MQLERYSHILLLLFAILPSQTALFEFRSPFDQHTLNTEKQAVTLDKKKQTLEVTDDREG